MYQMIVDPSPERLATWENKFVDTIKPEILCPDGPSGIETEIGNEVLNKAGYTLNRAALEHFWEEHRHVQCSADSRGSREDIFMGGFFTPEGIILSDTNDRLKGARYGESARYSHRGRDDKDNFPGRGQLSHRGSSFFFPTSLFRTFAGLITFPFIHDRLSAPQTSKVKAGDMILYFILIPFYLPIEGTN